jgi:RNA polymerase sigma-70 factor (ECF subfamily)
VSPLGRIPDLVVAGKLGEVLPCEHEHAGVVPSFERGGDVSLLAFAAAHPVRASVVRLTIGSPQTVGRRGVPSVHGQQVVSGRAEADGVIATMRTQSFPDLGTEDGMRHAFLVYGPELRAFAARRLGSWGAAEDAVQETLFRAWKHAGGYDPSRGSLRSWLYGIMRNLLVDLARAGARQPKTTPIVAGVGESDLTEPDEVDAVIGSLTMAAALRRLSPEHRLAVYHCYLKQRPHEEVARLLGVPVGTVRSRLFYARAALRNALERIGAADPETTCCAEAA